jgi:signal transduction histidine kinase
VAHWWPRRRREYTYDVVQRRRLQNSQRLNEILAATRDAEAFVAVPLYSHRQAIGQLYLTRRRAFDPSVVLFLLQVIEHTMPAIHHIRLVDRLASGMAKAERRRIANDLHDSVIQPYIWLCIGLGAIQQKLAAGGADVVNDLQRLLDLTNNKIDELRRYARGLRDKGEHIGPCFRLSAGMRLIFPKPPASWYRSRRVKAWTSTITWLPRCFRWSLKG